MMMNGDQRTENGERRAESIQASAAAAIEELQQDLEMFEDWEDRYEYIISLGKEIEPMSDDLHDDTHLVKGCQSRVWLVPSFDGERVHFQVDSDAIITKGLVAMLMRIYNHRTPQEILDVPNDFVQRLGLDTHLSQNRANGLASMMKQVKLYAVAYSTKSTDATNGQEQIAEPTDQGSQQSAPVSSNTMSTGDSLRDKVIEAIHTVYDPEIPVDIYELGLIYEVRTALDGGVLIVMTLTTPNCPSAQTLPADVERAARSVEGVTDVVVQITFDPPWDKTMMSEAALFSMGLF